MILDDEGYMIEQDIAHNKIIISLPQTYKTMINTVSPFDNDRKLWLSEEELSVILLAVKHIYKNL